MYSIILSDMSMWELAHRHAHIIFLLCTFCTFCTFTYQSANSANSAMLFF